MGSKFIEIFAVKIIHVTITLPRYIHQSNTVHKTKEHIKKEKKRKNNREPSKNHSNIRTNTC